MLLPDTNSAITFEQLREDVAQAHARREQKKDKNWNVTLTSFPTSASLLTSPSLTSFSIVDHLLSVNLIEKSSLVFLGSPEMELKLDFLNRVRMNSIQGRQIFCPIPYASYHPKVVQWINRTVKKPVGSSGHFVPENRNHVAFYVPDFLKAKEKVPEGSSELEDSICDFFRFSNLVTCQNATQMLKKDFGHMPIAIRMFHQPSLGRVFT